MKSRIGLFILIGLFLYIVDYRFSYDEDLNQIIIPDDEILGLIDTWRDQVGRDPSDEEIVRIINNLVNEEILYREALKLELDKNDRIIKRRLAQKVEFLKQDEIEPSPKDLENFYDGVIKFNFDELFNKNLGSEDYISIADISDFIFIINLPKFDKNNSNQQQRFITFIDIIYEKRIPLMITSEENLDFLGSSNNLNEPFKRTTSRLYELTSKNYS